MRDLFISHSTVGDRPRSPPAREWRIHSEYERRAEDAIEGFQQLAMQRQLTTQEIRQYNCYHTTYGNTPAPLPPPPTVSTPTGQPRGGGPAAPAHTPTLNSKD